MIRASCLDYRAIDLDLVHDQADCERRLTCPMLVLWGDNMDKRPGWQTGRRLEMMTVWREHAVEVEGHSLLCGHFLPEELPEETAKAILTFLVNHS